jgi:two-component system sensor histidine kinase HydH
MTMGKAVNTGDRERALAHGLVHKIRNVLNLIRTHIALMQRFTAGSADGRVQRRVDKLEEAVVLLDGILKEYLALVSPADDDWEVLDLAAVVQEVMQFVAADLEQAGVVVVQEFTPRPAEVYADRGKLKRVILNLILNARQAMPAGGQLTLRTQAAGRGWVVLEVSDTGCGIAEADQARIFQPFFSTKPEGLGLGLVLVQRTVEGYRGWVSFESVPNQGTIFRVTLPAARRLRAALERETRRQEWLQPTPANS